MTELATFEFDEKNYLYEEPRFDVNSVLMPIIKAEMIKYQPQQILEVGNNFYKHTRNTQHTVIDEHSTARNKPLKVSAIEFEPTQRFDLIFTLDMFYTGFALEYHKWAVINFLYLVVQSLSQDGLFWFAADTNISNLQDVFNNMPAIGMSLWGLKRTSKYLWKQCEPEVAIQIKNHKRTDGLIIGTYKRES
jgi:hypothetical protein